MDLCIIISIDDRAHFAHQLYTICMDNCLYYTGDCQCLVDTTCMPSLGPEIGLVILPAIFESAVECCNSGSMSFQSFDTCFVCKEIKLAVLLHNAVCMWSCTGCTCMISKIIGIVHAEANCALSLHL